MRWRGEWRDLTGSISGYIFPGVNYTKTCISKLPQLVAEASKSYHGGGECLPQDFEWLLIVRITVAVTKQADSDGNLPGDFTKNVHLRYLYFL